MAASGQYIDQARLLAVFSRQDLIELTDDEGLNEIDETVLQAAIDSAEGKFHSYAAKRYAVPVDLTSDPGIAETVRGILVDLVSHWLQSPPRRPATPESVQRKRDDAVRWLRDLAKGEVTLGQAPEPASSGLGGRAVVGGEERKATGETLSGL